MGVRAGVRGAYKFTKWLEPSAEYYRATGPVFDPPPRIDESHIVYPGADFELSDKITINVGLDFAATPAGNQLVSKVRIGWLIGKKNG